MTEDHTTPPREANLYLRVAGEDLFVTLHEPVEPAGATAVLMVPPFGWDAVTSHRPRRRWAEALAGAGYPTVRCDLPGTDDSAGGPRDADRLEAWTEAVGAVSAWLLGRTGAERIVVIGAAMGGIVAANAAARSPWITDLVLWATPARGRAAIREMQAFAALQGDGSFYIPSPPPSAEVIDAAAEATPDDGMVVNGHLLGDPSVADLRALDLSKVAWAPRTGGRALLLARDEMAPDARLSAALTAAGWAVSEAPGPGYAAMGQEPQLARAPWAVIESVSAWVGQTDGAPGPGAEGLAAARVRAAQVQERDCLTMPGLTERPVSFRVGDQTLRGVLCEPEVRQLQTCGVFLNSGAIRRIGPNRTWVEAARRWAQQGVATLRLDMPGIGDSDGDEDVYRTREYVYDPVLRDAAIAALEELERDGVASEFLLAGLCSGAYWAFVVAEADPRVRGVVLENPWVLHWDPDLERSRDLRKAFVLLRRRENIEWAIPFLRSALPRYLLALPLVALRRWRRTRRNRATLDRLRERGVAVRIDLSLGEPLYDDLKRDRMVDDVERWPNLTVEQVPAPDHTFRSLLLQRRLHRGLDEALARVRAHEQGLAGAAAVSQPALSPPAASRAGASTAL